MKNMVIVVGTALLMGVVLAGFHEQDPPGIEKSDQVQISQLAMAEYQPEVVLIDPQSIENYPGLTETSYPFRDETKILSYENVAIVPETRCDWLSNWRIREDLKKHKDLNHNNIAQNRFHMKPDNVLRC